MKYYLGIDGGGTRTTAAISDEKGNIIFKSVGKTINYYSVGMDVARENLSCILDDIKTKTGCEIFEGAFVGCSALDDEADAKTIEALCGGIINAKKLKMNSDVYVALASCGEEECRAVAICGTGSMTTGVTEKGDIIVKGGWGHIIGDEGSAYSIAVNALRACCILFDEKREAPLIEAAKKYFGVDNFRKAIDIIYSSDTSKDKIAGFAEFVGVIESDVIAETIIINEAHNYSRTVLSLLDDLVNCSALYLYGGVFQHNIFFRNIFEEDIRVVYPDMKIELLTIPPEEGALKAARDLL